MPSTEIKQTRIVGICQIRNEDVFIERVLTNILDFCDSIIVADHNSTDQTPSIVKRLAAREPKIKYSAVKYPGEAHELVRPYCNTPTWIFPVDGDELYDPHGLVRLRPGILTGEFDHYRQFYGHSLHCTTIDFSAKTATGYMTPPCRTVTKLYNFGALEDWKGPCIEKCLGGRIIFNPGWTEESNYTILDQFTWETSPFRLMHACFMKRSSLQEDNSSPTQNIVEIYSATRLQKLRRWIARLLGHPTSSRYKLDKYQRGPLAQYDASGFIPK
jgi:glycosyltransferase involved in cell wall biosynthesis